MKNGKTERSIVQEFLRIVNAYEPGAGCSVEDYVKIWDALLLTFHLSDEDVMDYINSKW